MALGRNWFDLVALVLGILGVAAAFLRHRAQPPGERRALIGTVSVFLVALAGLIWHHQAVSPTWTPHGSDWNQWYLSALSLQRGGVLYPPARWPLFGLLASGVDHFLPTPLFVDGQVMILASTALAGAGLFLAGYILMGAGTGLLAAGLGLTFPLVLSMHDWMNGYPLWGSSVVWIVAGLAAALEWRRTAWWVVVGTAWVSVLAVMGKGFGPALAALGTILLAIGFAGMPRWRALMGFVVPVAVLASIYAWLPVPLLSLEASTVAYVTADTSPPNQVDPNSGWVFGRSWSPSGMLHTIEFLRQRTVNREVPDVLLESNAAGLQQRFPSLRLRHLYWAGFGLLLGAFLTAIRRHSRRHLLTYLTLLALCVSFVPALTVVLNLRFVYPLALLLMLPAVVPFGGLRWGALLLFPLAMLVPGSPWRDPTPRLPTDVGATADMLATWYEFDRLEQIPEGAPTWVLCRSPMHALFAMDARPDWYYMGIRAPVPGKRGRKFKVFPTPDELPRAWFVVQIPKGRRLRPEQQMPLRTIGTPNQPPAYEVENARDVLLLYRPGSFGQGGNGIPWPFDTGQAQ